MLTETPAELVKRMVGNPASWFSSSIRAWKSIGRFEYHFHSSSSSAVHSIGRGAWFALVGRASEAGLPSGRQSVITSPRRARQRRLVANIPLESLTSVIELSDGIKSSRRRSELMEGAVSYISEYAISFRGQSLRAIDQARDSDG